MPWSPDRRLTIGNGNYTLELTADGRSFARSHRVGDQPPELDLTRRSDDRLQLAGKFVYLREAGRRRRLVVAGLAAPAPCRRHLRGRAALAAQPAARQRPRRRARRGRGRDHARGDRRALAAAARPTTATARARSSWSPTRSWRSHRGTPTAARRPTTPCTSAPASCARWVRSSPATGTSSRARRPHGGYPFAREVAFHAAGGADGSTVALTGYQDARPCFIGRGTLAAPDGLGVRPDARPRRRGPALLLRPDRQPAAARSSCRHAARPSCAWSTAMPPTRRWPPPRSPATCASPKPDPAKLDAGLRSARGRSTAACARPVTRPCPTASRPTARSWSSPARPRGPGTMSWPTRWAMVPSPRTTARSSPSPATPSRTRSPPATWTRCRSRSRPAPSTSSTSPRAGSTAPATRRSATPTPLYETVFGHGYATFTMQRDGLELELTVFVPPDEPVEIRLLTIRNRTGEPRRFRVVPYFEMALAEVPRDTRWLPAGAHRYRRARPTTSPTRATISARAGRSSSPPWPWSTRSMSATASWAGRSATSPTPTSSRTAAPTTRRATTAAGSPASPAPSRCRRTARRRSRSRWVRRPTSHGAELLAERHATLAVAEHALAETRRFWAGTLGDLRVETSQPAFDRLVNDWLPYQLLTARLWGRCGPSQRGGAFGFRDQLQDVLPLFAIRPDLARRQILLHAAPAVPGRRRAAVVASRPPAAAPAWARATTPPTRICGCPT